MDLWLLLTIYALLCSAHSAKSFIMRKSTLPRCGSDSLLLCWCEPKGQRQNKSRDRKNGEKGDGARQAEARQARREKLRKRDRQSERARKWRRERNREKLEIRRENEVEKKARKSTRLESNGEIECNSMRATNWHYFIAKYLYSMLYSCYVNECGMTSTQGCRIEPYHPFHTAHHFRFYFYFCLVFLFQQRRNITFNCSGLLPIFNWNFISESDSYFAHTPNATAMSIFDACFHCLLFYSSQRNKFN